jgi:hypothetical protein
VERTVVITKTAIRRATLLVIETNHWQRETNAEAMIGKGVMTLATRIVEVLRTDATKESVKRIKARKVVIVARKQGGMIDFF